MMNMCPTWKIEMPNGEKYKKNLIYFYKYPPKHRFPRETSEFR
jgi:hypothetical protein